MRIFRAVEPPEGGACSLCMASGLFMSRGLPSSSDVHAGPVAGLGAAVAHGDDDACGTVDGQGHEIRSVLRCVVTGSRPQVVVGANMHQCGTILTLLDGHRSICAPAGPSRHLAHKQAPDPRTADPKRRDWPATVALSARDNVFVHHRMNSVLWQPGQTHPHGATARCV